jgi:predicted Zn-dependent protease
MSERARGSGDAQRAQTLMRDSDQAIALALTLDPESPKTLTYLALRRCQEGKLDEAESIFQAALTRDDRGLIVLYNRAYFLVRTGRAAEAVAPLERACALHPEAPRVRNLLRRVQSALANAASPEVGGDAPQGAVR